MLIAGHCKVAQNGQPIAIIGSSALVGELAYATGALESATVITETPSLAFQLECNELHPFLSRNPEIALQISANAAEDMRGKLGDMTRILASRLADLRTTAGNR